MTNIYFAALLLSLVEVTNWTPVATVQNLQFRQATIMSGRRDTNFVFEVQFEQGRLQWTNVHVGPVVAYRLVGANDEIVNAIGFLAELPTTSVSVPHPQVSTPPAQTK